MLVEAGNSRAYNNDCVSRIRRVLKWAYSQDFVPVAVHQSLATLAGLRKGRSEADDPESIGPVSDELVEATIPFMSTVIADMVRFQRPRRQKTEHHGRQRVVFIGPLAAGHPSSLFASRCRGLLFLPR